MCGPRLYIRVIPPPSPILLLSAVETWLQAILSLASLLLDGLSTMRCFSMPLSAVLLLVVNGHWLRCNLAMRSRSHASGTFVCFSIALHKSDAPVSFPVGRACHSCSWCVRPYSLFVCPRRGVRGDETHVQRPLHTVYVRAFRHFGPSLVWVRIQDDFSPYISTGSEPPQRLYYLLYSRGRSRDLRTLVLM